MRSGSLITALYQRERDHPDQISSTVFLSIGAIAGNRWR
jgi:hypothetical protein